MLCAKLWNENCVIIGSDNDWSLFGTKPLSETKLTYYQFDPQEKTAMKVESKYTNFLAKYAPENVFRKDATTFLRFRCDIEGLTQDSGNSITLTLESPQSCTKPSIC